MKTSLFLNRTPSFSMPDDQALVQDLAGGQAGRHGLVHEGFDFGLLAGHQGVLNLVQHRCAPCVRFAVLYTTDAGGGEGRPRRSAEPLTSCPPFYKGR